MSWQRELRWQWRIFKAKRWPFRISVALIPVGILFYIFEALQGSGISGWLMRRDLENTGVMKDGFWGAMSFLLLAGVPFGFAIATEPDRTGPVPRGSGWVKLLAWFLAVVVAMLSFAGFSYWKGHSGPDLSATPVQWDVERTGRPPNAMTRLIGVPQIRQQFAYIATWSLGRGTNIRRGADSKALVPMTHQGWQPDEPVRYWLFTHNVDVRPDQLPTGLLLESPLPWYLRSVLERRGLKFAEPYYVLYTNAYQAERGNWDAMAAIFGFLGVVLLGLWLAMAIPEIRENLRRR